MQVQLPQTLSSKKWGGRGRPHVNFTLPWANGVSKCPCSTLSSSLCIPICVNPQKVTDFSGHALDAWAPRNLYHTTNCLKITKQKKKKTVFPSACYKGEEEPHSFTDQVVSDLLEQKKQVSLIINNKSPEILKIRSNVALQID